MERTCKLLLFLFVTVLVALLAAVCHLTISANVFGRIYNQRPGTCKTFKMNGSEDIILIPKINHAIITSGLNLSPKILPHRGKLFCLDMNDYAPSSSPVEIKFEDNYLEKNPYFNPHGINYWQDKTSGQIFLYIITHWENHEDSVESFIYNPETLSVKFQKSFRDPLLFWNLNSIVLVGRDQFYITRWHYFYNRALLTIEQLARLPLSSVIFYDGQTETGRVVLNGLKFCNGIAKSNNGKYIYVANSLAEQLNAYTKSEDNSLISADSTYIPLYVDNIKVDTDTGHIWAGVFPKCLDFAKHAKDHSFRMASQTLHIAGINEESSQPFTNVQTAQVFQSDSHGALSTGLHFKGHLLLGSVFGDMTVCEVNYLMY